MPARRRRVRVFHEAGMPSPRARPRTPAASRPGRWRCSRTPPRLVAFASTEERLSRSWRDPRPLPPDRRRIRYAGQLRGRCQHRRLHEGCRRHARPRRHLSRACRPDLADPSGPHPVRTTTAARRGGVVRSEHGRRCTRFLPVLIASPDTCEGTLMSEPTLDEPGPVDFLVVEFPAGHSFTGEIVGELFPGRRRHHPRDRPSSSRRTRTANGRGRTVGCRGLGPLRPSSPSSPNCPPPMTS